MIINLLQVVAPHFPYFREGNGIAQEEYCFAVRFEDCEVKFCS